MTAPQPTSPAAPTLVFRDGLGDRYHLVRPKGRDTELLRVAPALDGPDTERLVLERVARLTGFSDPAFVRSRGAERLAGGSAPLVVLWDRPDGHRLSWLLERASSPDGPGVELEVMLALLRLLTAAIARLHAADLIHGALGPERVLLTPRGELLVTDHVFAPALERLGRTRPELWRVFRVAVPPSAGGTRFDRRADVAALGLTGLSLLLGRPPDADDYPDRAAALLRDAAAAATATDEGREIGVWLARAAQIDPRRSFQSAADARAALDTGALAHVAPAGPVVLADWFARSSGMRRPSASMAVVPPVRPAIESTPAPEAEQVSGGPVPEPPRARRRWLSAFFGVVLICLLSLAGARVHVARTHAPATTGRLALASTPSGVDVFVDGLPKGATPVKLVLEPGAHIVELRGRGAPRVLPVRVEAGAVISHHVELDDAPADPTGQLWVGPGEPAAQVLIDGQARGDTPLTVLGLAAGPHEVVLERADRRLTYTVQVEGGVTARLDVPSAVWTTPVIGWVELKAPFEMQIFKGARLLGRTREGRFALPPGRHTLDVVNDTLAFRSPQVVDVRQDEVTPLRIVLPVGEVNVNAIPWAEVWLDGERVGDTPIGGLAVPLGAHELVFRHPQYGEKRHAVSVTLGAPVQVTVDMRS